MFQSLFNVYTKLKRPSSLFWLNIWSYSKNNTWVFLSQELLTFYIESLRGFKSVTVTTFQFNPSSLYRILLISLFVLQVGIVIG